MSTLQVAVWPSLPIPTFELHRSFPDGAYIYLDLSKTALYAGWPEGDRL